MLKLNALVTSVLTLPVLLYTAQNASAHKANFWVVNNTNQPITGLYVSESSVSNWLDNLVAGSGLHSGDSSQILFNNPNNYVCLYDVRAVFADGQVLEDYEINVCENDTYTFYDY